MFRSDIHKLGLIFYFFGFFYLSIVIIIGINYGNINDISNDIRNVGAFNTGVVVLFSSFLNWIFPVYFSDIYSTFDLQIITEANVDMLNIINNGTFLLGIFLVGSNIILAYLISKYRYKRFLEEQEMIEQNLKSNQSVKAFLFNFFDNYPKDKPLPGYSKIEKLPIRISSAYYYKLKKQYYEIKTERQSIDNERKGLMMCILIISSLIFIIFSIIIFMAN